MTNHAAEVARIRAEVAARDGAWMATIKAQLERGPAVSGELANACKIDRAHRGPFSGFLEKQKRSGALVVVGTQRGANGWPNNLWALP